MYFRCRTRDRALKLRRLRQRIEDGLASLSLESMSVRRVSCREQGRPSRETEVVVQLSTGRSVRAPLPKPTSAISQDDLDSLRGQLKKSHTIPARS